jgi:hypothetical protein
MTKITLLPLSLLVLAGLLVAAPALAGDAPAPAPVLSDAPFLCLANSSPTPAGSVPAPQPALFIFRCGVCSEVLCQNKNVGAACGAGPAFEGFRCNNPSSCPQDGLYTCTCELA